ncbi:hypothetical protein GCK72_023064 [Caenorhabditis remanei]|uniref:G-protein coupled receptors family 1 profile domain-containing protein n=1 Tax=Caenorhabditis remanei TaxID=31234 RepID=A0A6A5FVL7_CAERE|nr:hypothetical protein GCK72_023064 [Caenorhabditis remanei]KAF1746607.1 hypothetical protein GCK72_023064 [Caenorhabditis remanei]
MNSCSNKWLSVTYFTECLGCFLSFLMNAIFLSLLFKKQKTPFGNYQYLMAAFSGIGMFYSLCSFSIKPNFYVTENYFIIFTVFNNLILPKSLGSISLAIYGSCYAMMLFLITIQFYYRFTSVSDPVSLACRFSLKALAFWALLVILFSGLFGSLSYILYGPNVNKDSQLSQDFLKTYCLYSDEYVYIGPQYSFHNMENKRIYHILSIGGICITAIMMWATFLIVVYFIYRIYKVMAERGLPFYASKKLQRQLFKTLILQSLIPIMCMYIPLTFMFVFSMFGVGSGSVANLISMFAAIYPSLDPLLAMLCIKSMKARIKNIICCSRNRRVQIDVVDTDYVDMRVVYALQDISVRNGDAVA